MPTTKVIYSPEIQNPGKMSQKQIDAIAELKRYVPDLRPDLIIEGNLNLSRKPIKCLPDNLVVKGALNISDCHNLRELPQNVVVEGSFALSDNSMPVPNSWVIKGDFYTMYHHTLTDGFKVGGDLFVSEYIDHLPANLYVGGNLDLTKAKKIKELPSGLVVMGNLDLTELEITTLPEDLIVGGELNIRSTKIRSIPSSVQIRGGIDLAHTPIKIWPKQLTSVNGDINLHGSIIKKLPEGLVVKGNLYAGNSSLEELPENLHVFGYLDISETYIERLPDAFIVEDSLHLNDTPIEVLPDNLHVIGMLDITDTPIKKIPEGLIVNDTLMVDPTLELPAFVNCGCLQLDSYTCTLPEGLQVTGDVVIYSSEGDQGLKALPKNMKVGGKLRTWGGGVHQLEALPEGLYVGGDLELDDLRLTALPSGLHVGGNLNLCNQKVRVIPSDIRVDGILKVGGYLQWDIITAFLRGDLEIDGTVEFSHEDYKMGVVKVFSLDDEVRARLTRYDDDSVQLAPRKKEPTPVEGEISEQVPVPVNIELTEA